MAVHARTLIRLAKAYLNVAKHRLRSFWRTRSRAAGHFHDLQASREPAGAVAGMRDAMAPTDWDSDDIDPTVPVKATTARGSAPYSAALDPALTSTALLSQGGPMKVAAAAGSGNFTFRVPIAHYPGRGNLPLALDLVYNSRIWQRTGNTKPKMVFDIDRDWPAPGWSLHFGKIVRLANGVAMVVEPDGTRHPFKIDHRRDDGHYAEVWAHTTDGTDIKYDFVEYPDRRKLAHGTLMRPDGTSVEFGTPSTLSNVIYATRITDTNGNTITIKYVDDVGPQLDTVIDTCGRVIRFGYEEADAMTGRSVLFNVSGPDPGRPFDDTPVREMELVRFSVGGTALSYSFLEEVADAPLLRADALRAIFIPTTGTGFWFPPGSYSTYGMLKRVTACRGMSIPGPGQPNAGQIQPGPVSWAREYDYPDAGTVLTDSPTYVTLTETWAGQAGGPAVTRFQIQSDVETTRSEEITWPNGAKTITETKGAIGQTPAGLLSELTVLDPNGRQLQQVKSMWKIGGNGTPQVDEIHNINALGGLAKTTFSYEADATLPSIVDQWNYHPSQRIRRRTHTEYERDQAYLDRNLRNLPKRVRVFEPFNALPTGDLVPASWTEYKYDESELQGTPGIVGFDDRFNPDSPSYDRKTLFRGNVTTITRFADAAKRAAPITETRTYDRCGNLCTEDRGAGRTQHLYRAEARYIAPSATRLTATDPTDATMLEVIATSYLRNGQPSRVTDANGQGTALQYDAAGRLTRAVTEATGASVDVLFDDVAMVQTRTLRDGGTPPQVAGQEVLSFDGHGRVLSRRTALPGGSWSTVDYEYDLQGRLRASSAPHWLGEAVHWTTTDYDALHRPVRVAGPDGDVTLWRYDEAAGGPTNVWTEQESRVRITDPCGRERWLQFDPLGRVQQVVEPTADGSGSVLPLGGSLTKYRYDPNGNVITIDTWQLQSGESQRRQFRYDSLGRLVRLLLPEYGRGIVEAPGADGVSVWSLALAYDERSNLIFRKDSRGAITRYEYQRDPLDRLRGISYDNSEVTDKTSEVLRCADVSYWYTDTGDIRRVQRQRAEGVCDQTFTYDPFAGLTSTTVTMHRAPNFPFTVDYQHDTLGRTTGVVYPALYGGNSARPAVGLEYQQGAPAELTFEGQAYASGVSFWPTGAIKSMHVGPAAPAEVTENYDYDGMRPELKRQQLTRDGVRLLDLSYDYARPTFGAGQGMLQQLKTVTDHLDKAGSRAYAYDALGRLKHATGGEEPAHTWAQTYTYDSWGNRTDVVAGGEVTPGQAATADGATGLSYDKDTNRLIPNPANDRLYDAAGNLLVGNNPDTGRYHRYLYDTAGRLVRVEKSSLDDVDTEYVYGACNRRRATVRSRHHIPEPVPVPDPLPDDPVSISDPTKPYDTIESTTFYAWDGDYVIAEYDSPGPSTGDALTWSTTRVFFGSRLLSHRENLGAVGSRTLYDHPGLTGTRYVTGPNIQAEHESLPFGSSMITNGGTTPSFTSYDRDHRTGLDYAINRFYHPQLGRFLQPDPLGPAAFQTLNPQSLNLYTYCSNDPINYTDPVGLMYCVFGDCSDEEVLVHPMVVVVAPGSRWLTPGWPTDPDALAREHAREHGVREDRVPGRGGGGVGGGGVVAVLKPPSWFHSNRAKLEVLMRLMKSLLLSEETIQKPPQPPVAPIIRKIPPIGGPPIGGGVLMWFIEPSLIMDPCLGGFWRDPTDVPAHCSQA